MKKLLVFLVALTLSGLFATDFDPASLWQDGYCVQTTVRTPSAEEAFIQAKLDGKWQDFDLAEFPTSFWDWSTSRRHEYLRIIQEMITKGPAATSTPALSGPHNGIVASFGQARKDSDFKLNNAVKGMGFCPTHQSLDSLLELLEGKMDAPMEEKLQILDSLYTHAQDHFSPYALVSLELYSQPDYNTQTFINQMTNPACVTVFLDIPTFKIKQIARLLDPNDPNLTEYERKINRYVNLMHSFFHGKFAKDFIAVIYYNLEIYDSSPGKESGRGSKITP